MSFTIVCQGAVPVGNRRGRAGLGELNPPVQSPRKYAGETRALRPCFSPTRHVATISNIGSLVVDTSGLTPAELEREAIPRLTAGPHSPHLADSSSLIGAALPPFVDPNQPQFGQYRLLDVLGRGGQGCVYRAVRRGWDTPVALKMLPHADPNANPRFFSAEARALSLLRGSSSVVNILDSGEVSGVPFLAMELVNAKTLEFLIRSDFLRNKPLPYLINLARSICYGLEDANSGVGVSWYDLKPENILVTDWAGENPQAVLIDPLGLAYEFCKEDATLGTPAYMSPEQTTGKIGYHSDMYVFGVVLFEMIFGVHPFADKFPEGQTVVMLAHWKTSLGANPDLARCPSDLWRIIETCRQKKPESRFPFYSDLIRAFDQLEYALLRSAETKN